MKNIFVILTIIPLFLFSNDMRKTCRDGNIEDCFKMGKIYHYDRGNFKKALRYYKRACDGGKSQACKLMSDIYKNEDEFRSKRNMNKYKNMAIEEANKGCENGQGSACMQSGIYCETKYAKCNKEMQQKFYDDSLKNYQSECDRNILQSCYHLGNGYLYGIGTKIDEVKALEIFENNCVKNEKHSCYSAGNFYENGVYVKKDTKKAREYYDKSCRLGLQDGCDK